MPRFQISARVQGFRDFVDLDNGRMPVKAPEQKQTEPKPQSLSDLRFQDSCSSPNLHTKNPLPRSLPSLARSFCRVWARDLPSHRVQGLGARVWIQGFKLSTIVQIRHPWQLS